MRDSPDYGNESGQRRRDRSDSRDRDDDRRRREKYDDRRRHDRDRRTRSPRHERRDGSSDQPAARERSRSPVRRKGPLPSQNDTFQTDVLPSGQSKEKPNFKPTGLLAKEANTVAGTTTVLKYHEPAEGRKPPPSQQWRMYIFKGTDLIDTIYLFERSCWLIGRDQKITDLFLEHPSISKQHAVIQFRYSSTTNEFGDKMNRVKPYLIDLESANGTHINDKKIEESRYVELVDGDVIAFGKSEREYVMMLPAAEKK